MNKAFSRNLFKVSLLFFPIYLTGCLIGEEVEAPAERYDRKFKGIGKLFGHDLDLFNSAATKKMIHPDLWYGSLQALADFPLSIADNTGGIIETQWYKLPEFPKEQFKIKITIFPAEQLHIRALHVKVFRKMYKKNEWAEDGTSSFLEKTIKSRILLNARSFHTLKKNNARQTN